MKMNDVIEKMAELKDAVNGMENPGMLKDFVDNFQTLFNWQLKHGNPDQLSQTVYNLVDGYSRRMAIAGEGTPVAGLIKDVADLNRQFGEGLGLVAKTPGADVPSASPMEALSEIATQVMDKTDGDESNAYRNAAREYLIKVEELQQKLGKSTNPVVQQALKEEISEANADFARKLNEPVQVTSNVDANPNIMIHMMHYAKYDDAIKALGEQAVDQAKKYAADSGMQEPDIDTARIDPFNRPNIYADSVLETAVQTMENKQPLNEILESGRPSPIKFDM